VQKHKREGARAWSGTAAQEQKREEKTEAENVGRLWSSLKFSAEGERSSSKWKGRRE